MCPAKRCMTFSMLSPPSVLFGGSSHWAWLPVTKSRVGDNHHHVVCRSCGVIADVDCAVGDAPCLTPSDDDNVLEGFVLDEAEVIYWGRCPNCVSATPDHSRDHSPTTHP